MNLKQIDSALYLWTMLNKVHFILQTYTIFQIYCEAMTALCEEAGLSQHTLY